MQTVEVVSYESELHRTVARGCEGGSEDPPRRRHGGALARRERPGTEDGDCNRKGSGSAGAASDWEEEHTARMLTAGCVVGEYAIVAFRHAEEDTCFMFMFFRSPARRDAWIWLWTR